MDGSSILKQIDITQIRDNHAVQIKDSIIDEDILKIFINQQKAFEMVFSNTHASLLAVGFLFTQGIVHDRADIITIHSIEAENHCYITLNDRASQRLDTFKKNHQIKGSSGGALLNEMPVASAVVQRNGAKLTRDQVLSLIQAHWDHSVLFHKTGAVHSAGLCDPGSILSYYEDIGRHNAIDKLAGDILLNRINTHDKIATVSCRMSIEIIGKIIRTGIPIVISNAAPTLSAVHLADRAGVTIVGFARNNRFNIYTHENRILANPV